MCLDYSGSSVSLNESLTGDCKGKMMVLLLLLFRHWTKEPRIRGSSSLTHRHTHTQRIQLSANVASNDDWLASVGYSHTHTNRSEETVCAWVCCGHSFHHHQERTSAVAVKGQCAVKCTNTHTQLTTAAAAASKLGAKSTVIGICLHWAVSVCFSLSVSHLEPEHWNKLRVNTTSENLLIKGDRIAE